MGKESTDLVVRLRDHAKLRTAMSGDNGNTAMLREAADEIERHRVEFAHLCDLAKRDHDDLQTTIARLHLLILVILNSDMAQMAEDEGRVVPELAAARRILEGVRP